MAFDQEITFLYGYSYHIHAIVVYDHKYLLYLHMQPIQMIKIHNVGSNVTLGSLHPITTLIAVILINTSCSDIY